MVVGIIGGIAAVMLLGKQAKFFKYLPKFPKVEQIVILTAILLLIFIRMLLKKQNAQKIWKYNFIKKLY